MLPDRDRFRALIQDVEDTFATRGPGAGDAGPGFRPADGRRDGAGPADPRRRGRAAGRAGPRDPGDDGPDGAEHAVLHRLRGAAVRRLQPDVAALRASSARIVMAVGEQSVGEPPARAAVAVAELLGSRGASRVITEASATTPRTLPPS